MRGGNAGRGRRAWIAEAALWPVAGLIVLAAHAGAAAWLLRERPAPPADEAPPSAIMIELAEAPEAVRTEDDEISPDTETAETSGPAEAVPEETPPEERAPDEDAPEDAVEPLPDTAQTAPAQEVVEARPEETDPVEEDHPLLESVEVPVPTPRPAPPKPAREKARTEAPPPAKRSQQAQDASKQAVEAQARVAPSNRNAARQTASGLFSASVSPARWQSRLMAHLERRKRYPAGARARREEGTVHVRFSIDAAGNVQSVSLARSSGHPELDEEVLSLVRRASPVPAPPPGADRTIAAPVRFSVR